MSVDSFYPISQTVQACPGGMWQISMTVKITSHLADAKAGSRDAESRLINRVGQLRRNVENFGGLGYDLKDAVLAAVTWLRSVGRRVDFSNPDARYWVTARDGVSPRW